MFLLNYSIKFRFGKIYNYLNYLGFLKIDFILLECFDNLIRYGENKYIEILSSEQMEKAKKEYIMILRKIFLKLFISKCESTSYLHYDVKSLEDTIYLKKYVI